MNKPEYIIIHHSFTNDGDTKDWDAIRRYHIEENGWEDIGYHFGVEVVNGSLTYQVGRPWWKIGAHTKEMDMNGRSLGVCLIGNYDEEPPPGENLNYLRDMIWAIQINWKIPTEKVVGHREVGLMAGYDWEKDEYKTCPGRSFDMDSFRALLNEEVSGWSGFHLLDFVA